MAVILGGLALLAACDEPVQVELELPSEYVGRAACAGYHQAEALSWTGSHHDLAMQNADEVTVKGDFDDAEFNYAGVTTTFFRAEGRFMVRTGGPGGVLRDYEIAYTFGTEPCSST